MGTRCCTCCAFLPFCYAFLLCPYLSCSISCTQIKYGEHDISPSNHGHKIAVHCVVSSVSMPNYDERRISFNFFEKGSLQL
jgi:hypothetical protein